MSSAANCREIATNLTCERSKDFVTYMKLLENLSAGGQDKAETLQRHPVRCSYFFTTVYEIWILHKLFGRSYEFFRIIPLIGSRGLDEK
jgi:hypothetical protein